MILSYCPYVYYFAESHWNHPYEEKYIYLISDKKSELIKSKKSIEIKNIDSISHDSTDNINQHDLDIAKKEENIYLSELEKKGINSFDIENNDVNTENIPNSNKFVENTIKLDDQVDNNTIIMDNEYTIIDNEYSSSIVNISAKIICEDNFDDSNNKFSIEDALGLNGLDKQFNDTSVSVDPIGIYNTNYVSKDQNSQDSVQSPNIPCDPVIDDKKFFIETVNDIEGNQYLEGTNKNKIINTDIQIEYSVAMDDQLMVNNTPDKERIVVNNININTSAKSSAENIREVKGDLTDAIIDDYKLGVQKDKCIVISPSNIISAKFNDPLVVKNDNNERIDLSMKPYTIQNLNSNSTSNDLLNKFDNNNTKVNTSTSRKIPIRYINSITQSAPIEKQTIIENNVNTFSSVSNEISMESNKISTNNINIFKKSGNSKEMSEVLNQYIVTSKLSSDRDHLYLPNISMNESINTTSFIADTTADKSKDSKQIKPIISISNIATTKHGNVVNKDIFDGKKVILPIEDEFTSKAKAILDVYYGIKSEATKTSFDVYKIDTIEDLLITLKNIMAHVISESNDIFNSVNKISILLNSYKNLLSHKSDVLCDSIVKDITEQAIDCHGINIDIIVTAST